MEEEERKWSKDTQDPMTDLKQSSDILLRLIQITLFNLANKEEEEVNDEDTRNEHITTLS